MGKIRRAAFREVFFRDTGVSSKEVNDIDNRSRGDNT